MAEMNEEKKTSQEQNIYKQIKYHEIKHNRKWDEIRCGSVLCTENVFQSKSSSHNIREVNSMIAVKKWKSARKNYKTSRTVRACSFLARRREGKKNIFLRNVLFKHGSFINLLCCICCCFHMASFSVKIYNSFFPFHVCRFLLLFRCSIFEYKFTARDMCAKSVSQNNKQRGRYDT